ncbi:hypothetical protein VTL71DRAFT_1122 [Oculimacula yallundae]|uniref:Uncharacterized protein n=1 Tax=Oculimacula yallundae TaxID=86028 RepID=A0ABR4D202_9HELO
MPRFAPNGCCRNAWGLESGAELQSSAEQEAGQFGSSQLRYWMSGCSIGVTKMVLDELAEENVWRTIVISIEL